MNAGDCTRAIDNAMNAGDWTGAIETAPGVMNTLASIASHNDFNVYATKCPLTLVGFKIPPGDH